MAAKPKPRVFAKLETLRAWFEKNHDAKTELWMKYYKVGTDRACVRYAEALDEALCWGWIDGIVRSIDDESYMQRWTPRRKDSHWSAVNIGKVKALIEAGRMQPPGLAAFEARDPKRSGSNEAPPQELPKEMEKTFRADRTAWAYWQEQPPGYKRNCIGLVLAAKKEETRQRRFAELLAAAARKERWAKVSPPKAPAKKRAGGRT